MIFSKYTVFKNTSANSFYRDYYEDINIKFDSTDYYVVINEEHHLKPGKMAEVLYGTSDLFWIFSYFNRDIINDPLFDFTSGKIIRVPEKNRLLTYF